MRIECGKARRGVFHETPVLFTKQTSWEKEKVGLFSASQTRTGIRISWLVKTQIPGPHPRVLSQEVQRQAEVAFLTGSRCSWSHTSP